jgi:hypothetical protein
MKPPTYNSPPSYSDPATDPAIYAPDHLQMMGYGELPLSHDAYGDQFNRRHDGHTGCEIVFGAFVACCAIAMVIVAVHNLWK